MTIPTIALGAAAVLLGLALAVLAARRARWRRARMEVRFAGDTTLAEELRANVESLCAIGPRNVFEPGSMDAAAGRIEAAFDSAGLRTGRQAVEVESEGVTCDNVVAEIRGGEEVVVVGAHYDSVYDSPGADDNASGVAALLAIARRLAGSQPARTLRFVAFANEEPPHFQTPEMGSLQYARRCSARGERVVAMLSLEMLGYFDPRPGAQQYPPPLAALYPDTGDFIAFVGNLGSRALAGECVRTFRAHCRFPAESGVFPELIPEVGWSDQWAFWQFGWPAIMITDTALYRNPYYHTSDDVPATLDYAAMAQVVEGLVEVVRQLSGDAGRRRGLGGE